MKEIKVVKENPCDDCGIKGLYDNCKSECVQYRKYYQYQQGRADAEKRYQLEYDRQIDNEQEAFENGYEKGRADERQRIINVLKSKSWVEDEHAHLLYDSVLVPISAIMSEIVDEIENE